MQATKSRHFDLLTSLEQKYQDHGSASAEEQALLSQLLADHDQQVGAFKHAIASLRQEHPADVESLLEYIAALNSALAPFQTTQADAKAN